MSNIPEIDLDNYDFEDDGPDDGQEVELYADDLHRAVQAFGLTPLETGEHREDD